MTIVGLTKRLLGKYWIFTLALVASSLSSCAVGEFFSQRYENSVAYFNTYYNATRLYDEAILEIETTEKNQRSKGLPPQKDISGTARQKLTTVIEKCSKLLLYHPTSKWVDDALMLIGKSYFYMGEYVKAERKFAELIAQFPESDQFLEARLWLGRSFRRGNEEDRAIRELTSVADTAMVEPDNAIAAAAFLELGEIHTERENYEAAIEAYHSLIDRSDYDDLKPEAQSQLAHLNEIIGDYGKAAEAYRKVEDYDPDPYTRFRSELLYAVNKKRMKDYDEALRVLFALLEDRANVEYFPQIKLEIATVYDEREDLESAIEAYVVIDTTYRRTDVAAKAYYQLGLLYEKELRNFAAAETNYVRARAEFPSSEIVPLAAKHAENLSKYKMHRRMITDLDSMIVLERRKIETGTDTLMLSQSDSLADTTKTRADSVWYLHTELWDTTGGSASMRALKSRLATQTYDLGLLFFLELEEPDSAMYWCNKTVDLSVDSELSARALYTLAEIQRTSKNEARASVDSLYKRIVSDYPNTKCGNEVRRILGLEPEKAEAADSAAVAYRRAEKLIQEKRTTEAIDQLRTVMRQYPTSSFSAKSQYAIGWIYENVENHPDSALQNYRALTKQYPTSVYANAVTPKLADRAQWEAQAKAKRDSSAVDSLQHSEGSSANDSLQLRRPVVPDSSSQQGLLDAGARTLGEPVMEDSVRAMRKSKVDSTRKRLEE